MRLFVQFLMWAVVILALMGFAINIEKIFKKRS